MERNLRRKYASRRTSRKKAPEAGTDFRSRLLVQCMICGVALAAVLLMCIINAEFSNDVRVTVKNAITKQTDIDDLKELAGSSKDKLTEAGDLLNSLFGFSNASDLTDPYLTTPIDEEGVEVFGGVVTTEQQNEPSIINSNTGANIDTGPGFEFRIDEDILNEMNTRTDMYAESKKASAPEPSFIPELR